jgi:hypothetical protein
MHKVPKWRLGLATIAVASMAVLAVGPAANAAVKTRATIFTFPSANSTVIGSVGFINSCEVGYFWSVSRGDSVAQTFNGPASITKALLKAVVVQNVLNSGAHVDWTLSINGIDVGRFRVNQGVTGTISLGRTFAAITGPSYAIKIRVTNEVASGQGSITLAYACSPHGIGVA